MIGPEVSEAEVVASLCRGSFWEFVQEFWHETIDEPMVSNWHMPYLCDEIQYLAEHVFERKPKPYDLVVNVPPGSTKSTIVSVMAPIWFWTRKAWIQTICGSYDFSLAMDLSQKSRSIVQSTHFLSCWPKLRLRKDKNTKTVFQNVLGGWRYACSTGGSVTGWHGHVIIVDDPLDPNGSNSEAEVKAANEWISQTLSKRKVSLERTPTILIMQRLADSDPTAEMLEWQKKGLKIKHIRIPAELGPGIPEPKPPELKTHYVDGLFDPVRFGRAALAEQKLVGELIYAGQFLQNPVPPSGGMFKVAKIEVRHVAPESRMVLVRYWDKAATPGGGAYTVGVLMGKGSDGKYYVLDVKRVQYDAGEREKLIKQTAELDGRSVTIIVEQEPGSGGLESAQATVRNLAGFKVGAHRPTGDKIYRADPYAAQVNAGNVVVNNAEWTAEYLKELMNFGKLAKYKDQVDASSGAFAWLSKNRKQIGAISLG